MTSRPTPVPRWFTDTDDGHSEWYAEHFRGLVQDGHDVEGEARLLDAIVPPHSRVLDAGCGQGRTAGALSIRGHQVVGVDIDPHLIESARVDHPGPRYICADLGSLSIETVGGEPFDAAVSAGNVITFVAPGTEIVTLAAIRSVLKPDAPFVVGFHAERYNPKLFNSHLVAAGFILESRFATWDLRPWHPAADFCVSILRVPVID